MNESNEIFGRFNLEAVFKKRTTYKDSRPWIDCTDLHKELNEIALKRIKEMGYIRNDGKKV